MNLLRLTIFTLLPCLCLTGFAAVRYVDLNSPNPASPYTDWSTAATNIQDAIDASVDDDFIWVTNGVYATGGKVMSGDLTNRVTLDKAVTVQSVNGPWVTIIQGAGATNGTSAVRCAWLTNSAVLQGFTLRAGAVRLSGGTTNSVGGGVWCASSNATVANCLIISNTASPSGAGGGAYQGTLRNCSLMGNACYGTSAAFGCLLYNCTVVSNFQAVAISGSTMTNCIVYSNPNGNYVNAALAYCCTTPLPSGPGNITANPQLLADNLHLASTSPCRGAGINLGVGTDIDGQPWSNPPSIGCDDWQPPPIVITAPAIHLTSDPAGFTINVAVAGQDPFTCLWLRNGSPVDDDGHFSSSHTTNLVAFGVGLLDGGSYQVIASNAWGMATSVVAQLVVHYVDATSTNPLPPYSDWSTAASTIQDAIDAAMPGEVVLVTNGVYATGGKSWGGALTNRVVLNKSVLVQSVNGAAATVIQGAWDPATTNGPLAARCAWLTNNSTLSGFTLRGGATLPYAASGSVDQSGAGVWGAANNNAVVVNCLLTGNCAGSSGGGAYRVLLTRCTLTGNAVLGNGVPGAGSGASGGADSSNLRNCIISKNWSHDSGGGAGHCTLLNCAVVNNYAAQSGGGVYSGSLVNCTVTGNLAGSANNNGTGGGTYSANVTNSIVYGNQSLSLGSPGTNNYYSGTFGYCCSLPLPTGTGNISADPQLLSDGIHVLPTSPCRGGGLASIALGTDIDGQAWANPPSIGCDEWWPAPAVTGAPQVLASGAPAALSASAVVAGQPPFNVSWLKDGTLLDDNSHYSSSHTTNLVVSNFGPADAGGYQLIASNAFGMVTSAVAQVVVHCADPVGVSPLAPYSDWSTAASNIQDAIDSADSGDFVLSTNGIYSTGGRQVGNSITNRVVIPKAITVISVNGPGATVIAGAWDPVLTNGPAAIRGVWMVGGATLSGFTVQNGATGGSDVGGGVYATSTNACLSNCVLTNNQSSWGGGCYQALLTKCTLIANQSVNYGGAAYRSVIIGSLITRNWARAGGGGTYLCTLLDCNVISNSTSSSGGGSYQDTVYGSVLFGNSAGSSGGGAYGSTLYNCTVTGNYALQPASSGGGIYTGTARNSIIYFNQAGLGGSSPWPNYLAATLSYCCTTPAATGTGNITADPQLLDGVHIATISPCRGAGSTTYASGTDIDGEPWTNPPSIGCDEVWEAALTGPLGVALTPRFTTVAQYGSDGLSGQVIGRATRVAWDFGDGTTLTNASHVGLIKIWTNPGDYTVTFTAYNGDNPAGVSTNALIHVVPLVSPAISTTGLSGNNFSLSFTAQPGIIYVVEQTTNLAPPIVWNWIWSFVGAGTSVQVTDTQAKDAARFYRVRSQ